MEGDGNGRCEIGMSVCGNNGFRGGGRRRHRNYGREEEACVAGQEEEEEGSVRQDASRKNKGGTCIRFPTGDKRPRREVSRDGNTRENVDTRVSSRGPAVDRVA